MAVVKFKARSEPFKRRPRILVNKLEEREADDIGKMRQRNLVKGGKGYWFLAPTKLCLEGALYLQFWLACLLACLLPCLLAPLLACLL